MSISIIEEITTYTNERICFGRGNRSQKAETLMGEKGLGECEVGKGGQVVGR